MCVNFVGARSSSLKETSIGSVVRKEVCVKKTELFYIPLLELLRCLLNNTTVFEEV